MIKDIFFSLRNRGVAFLICIAYIFIFTKFYEKFIEKGMRNRFKFLNDRNKEVAFEVLVTGFIGLLLLLFIRIIGFRINMFWWTMGILATLGGALGLIPFSFIEKSKSK